MKIKSTIAVGTFAALVGAWHVANAQGGFGPPELTTYQVRDNIYVIRNAMSGNVTVLVSDDGVLLIETSSRWTTTVSWRRSKRSRISRSST